MATKRTKRESKGEGPIGGGWKQAAPAAILVGIVFTILVLSAMLQTDPEPLPPAADLEPPAESPVEPVRPQPAPEQSAAAPSDDPLESRCRSDYARISDHRTEWTLQFMIACDPGNALRIIERSRRSDRLYVLPFDYDGRRCFRLCWGVYGSRDRAVANRGRLPSFIRELEASTPKSIGEVAP